MVLNIPLDHDSLEDGENDHQIPGILLTTDEVGDTNQRLFAKVS